MLGYESRCKERDTITVQVSCKVFSGRCFRRTDSRSHTGMDDNSDDESDDDSGKVKGHDLVGL